MGDPVPGQLKILRERYEKWKKKKNRLPYFCLFLLGGLVLLSGPVSRSQLWSLKWQIQSFLRELVYQSDPANLSNIIQMAVFRWS